MFARWRKVIAAAGALCFPYAIAQSPAYSDDLYCPRFGVCSQYQDPMIDQTSKSQLESWYQRYYQNNWQDNAVADEQGVWTDNIASLEDTDSSGDDWLVDQDEATFLQGTTTPDDVDSAPWIDSNGQCSDPTCPCHDVIDLSDDGEEADSQVNAGVQIFAPDFDADYLSVPAPAPTETEADDFVESSPTAFLSGTIEPIFDECDEVWDNPEAFDSQFGNEDSGVQLEGVIAPEADSEGDVELNGIDFELDDSSFEQQYNEGSQFHMFYPGCDWNHYYPAEARPAEHA